MAESEATCSICGRPSSDHNSLNTEIHHLFSTSGELAQVPDKKMTAEGGAKGSITLGRLIAMLHNKGILDDDDVARLIGHQ